MKQENQLCTLEQSKRLKELGITQESQFYWLPKWKASDGELLFIGQKCDKGFYHCIDGVLDTFDHPSPYSAYTVAELAVMIPPFTPFSFMKIGDGKGRDFYWGDMPRRLAGNESDSQSLARTLASFLIYLLETNLTTADDCNERLNQA